MTILWNRSAAVIWPLIITTWAAATPPPHDHYVTELAASAHSKKCLNQTCGRISGITYPFAIDHSHMHEDAYFSCLYHSNDFLLHCNDATKTLYGSQTALLRMQVLKIYNDGLIVNFTEINAAMKASKDHKGDPRCNESVHTIRFGASETGIGSGPYIISDDNNFGSFGCSTGTLSESGLNYGCSVQWSDQENNPRCSNETCCVVSMPPVSIIPTRSFNISVDYDFDDDDENRMSDPACSCNNNYAIIFHHDHTDFATKTFGVKMKWAILSLHFNDTSLLLQDLDYACARNASPVPVPEIEGYLCSCEIGFHGDGYVSGTGCSDVNECEHPLLNLCMETSTCVNTKGSYKCDCRSRFHVGDGRHHGSGCNLSPFIVKTIMSYLKCMHARRSLWPPIS